MPRDGSLTPRDLIEKLAVLRLECPKGGRSGHYRVIKLAETTGWECCESIARSLLHPCH